MVNQPSLSCFNAGGVSFLRPFYFFLTIAFLALPIGCAKTVPTPPADKAVRKTPAPKILPPEPIKEEQKSIKEEQKKEKKVRKEVETEKNQPVLNSHDQLRQNATEKELRQNAPENVQIKGGKYVPLEGYEWVNPSDPNDFRVTPIWNK